MGNLPRYGAPNRFVVSPARAEPIDPVPGDSDTGPDAFFAAISGRADEIPVPGGNKRTRLGVLEAGDGRNWCQWVTGVHANVGRFH